jgi:hypothetical protein
LKTRYRLDVRKLYDIEELRSPLENEIYQYDVKKRELVWRDVVELLEESSLDEVEQDELITELHSRWQDLNNPDEGFENFDDYETRLKISDKVTETIDSVNELSLIDLRTNTKVSHRDVGIGISQVLPVLVNAYGSDEKIHAIEQPEIHLHPALQAELGDVFIESALYPSNNRFLIETHSEHLILRILRRIRETSRNKYEPAIKPEDVSLLYIGENNQQTSILNLRIDKNGRIIDRVPGGFFEEDFAEMF